MKLIPILIMAALLAGCAPLISEESRRDVSAGLTYEMVMEQPERHIGKQIMLGGLIVGSKNTLAGGELEIRNYPLGGDEYPDDSQGSKGNFLALFSSRLEEEFDKPGTLVTVVGELKGVRTASSAGGTATLPLVAVRDIHIWLQEDPDNRPYLIPGTHRVDPYYNGHDSPMIFRPEGQVIRP
jgi:outer membrane lipoprotein